MRWTGVQWPGAMIPKFCAALLIVFLLGGVCLAKTQVNDDTISNDVRIKLASDTLVNGGGLQVDVNQGVVTLSGSVERPQQKDRAEKVAKKVKGVKQVINKITLRK